MNRFTSVSHIVISVIVIVISGVSLLVSCDALKHSKAAFIIVNRPYLNVSLIKFEETDSYFKVSKKDKIVQLEMQFDLINKGKTPATKISVPKAILFGGNIKQKDKSFKIELPPNITLGPEQSQNFIASFGIGSNVISADELIKEIESGLWTVDIEMVWLYTSIPDDKATYKTPIGYSVKNKEAIRTK